MKRNRMWEKLWGPLWGGQMASARFMAQEPAEGGGSEPATFDFSKVFDEKGVLTENWTEPFQDVIGDSKYFQTAFKPGRDSIKELVKHVKDLSGFKGRALLPKADASDEEWDKVFSAAGIPEKPEEYELEIAGVDEDPEFKDFLESAGYKDRMEAIFADGKLPKKMAVRMADAILRRAQSDFEGFRTASREYRTKYVDPELAKSKTKYEDAEKRGREALAKLYGHSEQAPNEEFGELLHVLKSARLDNHPLVINLLHRLHTRMFPAHTFMPGGANRQTGPGVRQENNLARVMMPKSVEQLTALGI